MGSGVCWGSPTADVAIPGEGSPPLGLQPCQPLSAAGAGGDVGAAPLTPAPLTPSPAVCRAFSPCAPPVTGTPPGALCR